MPKADGKSIQERFNARYVVDPVTGCWNWSAGLNGKGYAYIWTGPRAKSDTRQAYKVAWEFKFGPVPEGLELHHKCENRKCVNPDHLEASTRKGHQRKHPNMITTQNAALTACKRGHEFTPVNTWTSKKGSRHCRACARLRNARKGARAL